MRIGIHLGKRVAIGVTPAAQNQAIGVELQLIHR